MPIILLFTDWFAPGFKAGGPIRSTVNFVEQMKNHYTIFVFTSDRDLNESKPYPDILTNKWIQRDNNVSIYYCSPANQNRSNLQQVFSEVSPDFVYLNSMFSLWYTIVPLLIARSRKIKTILAPRGMLKPSALRFRPAKKKLYLSGLRTLNFHRHITFHATDKTEVGEVNAVFGKNVKTEFIPNLPAPILNYPGAVDKSIGGLRMIFVGRIHPIKNLHFLLELLRSVSGDVHLSIVGNIEDESYYQSCKNLAEALGSKVAVEFVGEVPNDKIANVLADKHLFVLPTTGENYGHAIFEAMQAGKPVLVSDQTPWRDLAIQKAGWDIPLTNRQGFVDVINTAIAYDQAEYGAWSYGAWNYVKHIADGESLTTAYQKLFSN